MYQVTNNRTQVVHTHAVVEGEMRPVVIGGDRANSVRVQDPSPHMRMMEQRKVLTITQVEDRSANPPPQNLNEAE